MRPLPTLLLLALLPSCAPAFLSPDPHARTIHGVRVSYQLATDFPSGKVASAQRLGDRCLIRVHPEHANAFILAHELAEKADAAEPYWKALREGRTPTRIPGSAPALAEDYVLFTQEVLTRIAAHEEHEATA